MELPESLARRIDPSGCNLARRVFEALVAHLVYQGMISSGKGAKLLGISKDEARGLLREYGVPYFNLSPEELRAELEASRLGEVNRQA